MESSLLRQWIEQSGLPKARISKLSGVSLSSIHRIENKQTDPQLGTLRELAISCGLELELSIRPLADAYSAQAARCLLEDHFEPDNKDATSQWVERFERAKFTNPIDILQYAGQCSGLLSQDKPAVYMRGETSELRLASAGDASDKQWALSGKSHLELGTGEKLSGPDIIWTEDPRLVASLLADSLTVARSAATATVIVAAGPPAHFANKFTVNHVSYVAPIQALIDGFSLGHQLAEAANKIAQGW